MTGSEAAHRLHPSSLLFRLFPLVKSFLVPALVVYFLSADGRWQLWLPLLILPALLVEWYRTRTLRYRFTEEELVITTGRWFRGERHIPYTRIQNIDLVQGPLHRLLDVGEVRLETASGAGAEATLVVLSRAAERALRDAVARGRRAAPGGSALPEDEADAALPRERGEALLELRAGELARIALDPGRSLLPLGVLFGLAWEFDVFERFAVRQRIEAWLEAGGLGFGWWDGVIIGLAALLLLTLFSLIGTTLLFHGFRLRLVEGQFRIRRGLLTRVRATVPRRRIQMVTVHASALHRWMGRVRVRVGTAGQGAHEEDDDQEESWLAPLLPVAALPALLAHIDPRLVEPEVGWRPYPRSALRRARRLAWRVGILLTLLLLAISWLRAGLSPAVALLGPLAGALGAVRAGLRWRHAAYALDGDRLCVREGWWKRRTSSLLLDKLQSVTVEASYFDRRWGQATLWVDTAGGAATGHEIVLPRLETPLAEALQRALLERAASERFRW